MAYTSNSSTMQVWCFHISLPHSKLADSLRCCWFVHIKEASRATQYVGEVQWKCQTGWTDMFISTSLHVTVSTDNGTESCMFLLFWSIHWFQVPHLGHVMTAALLSEWRKRDTGALDLLSQTSLTHDAVSSFGVSLLYLETLLDLHTQWPVSQSETSLWRFPSIFHSSSLCHTCPYRHHVGARALLVVRGFNTVNIIAASLSESGRWSLLHLITYLSALCFLWGLYYKGIIWIWVVGVKLSEPMCVWTCSF